MQYTKEEAFELLLKSYRTYYNIEMKSDEDIPWSARCDYYEHSQKYVLSRKAELWSTKCEEFIYIFCMEHFSLEQFRSYEKSVLEDGMSRMHIGPGHMSSYIVPVFLCTSFDKEILQELKKCRHYKSFHFSFHGWMDYHAALVDLTGEQIYTNKSGRHVARILKKILFKREKKGRVKL